MNTVGEVKLPPDNTLDKDDPLYLPKVHRKHSEGFKQIRLGIVGAPGNGKTTAALTFPNPIVWDFDRGLRGVQKAGLIVMPVYDKDFCIEFNKADPNPKKIFLKFLKEEAHKLRPNQTLIVDSASGLEACFDLNTPIKFDNGKEDTRAFWGDKLDYFTEVFELLKGCGGNVVVTFHEDELRDPATGAAMDKIKPLMGGSFKNKVGGTFSDFYRATVEVEEKKEGTKIISVIRQFFWQIQQDSRFSAKNQLGISDYKIKADYAELVKHFK